MEVGGLVCSLGTCGGLAVMKRMFRRQQAVQGRKMWGYVVIPDGERWKVTHANARIDIVSGPKVIRVWEATMCQLRHFTATSAEYLTVRHVSGRSEVLPGPTSLHMDPSIHKEVKVHAATNLGEHEVLVVYRSDEDGTSAVGVPSQGSPKIERFLIQGPCLHVPRNCTEWTHEFKWHGSSPADENAARKRKDALNFTKLRTCPDQTYYDVEVVRTKDDALVTVKLMIFYRLKDIAVMLRETHDPIADIINAVTSDVIEFVASRTFEEFKLSSEHLNNLAVYKQLTSRAASIGFEVTKVVFRGYGAPDRLQKMHNDAIEQRTKLALQRETEEQEQQLYDMRQGREEERLRRTWQTESDAKAHELQLAEAAHGAEMSRTREEREAKIAHLLRLKQEVGVPEGDLAAYLLAVEQGPPGKLIQIVGKSGSSLSCDGGFVQIQEAS